MAIYEVTSLKRAEELMAKAFRAPWTYYPMVFLLDESINPDDVEVSISVCEECKTLSHLILSDDGDVCPKCSQPMKPVVEAALVIQGDVVIRNTWRPL